eukprot:c12484_g1_i1.p1 GENE.c12484_g1_i1~~c12484_g1_i1.p1  ORF type:complete len:253 (+),score=23.77 c12484_g1_i1:482-1240(+)
MTSALRTGPEVVVLYADPVTEEHARQMANVIASFYAGVRGGPAPWALLRLEDVFTTASGRNSFAWVQRAAVLVIFAHAASDNGNLAVFYAPASDPTATRFFFLANVLPYLRDGVTLFYCCCEGHNADVNYRTLRALDERGELYRQLTESRLEAGLRAQLSQDIITRILMFPRTRTLPCVRCSARYLRHDKCTCRPPHVLAAVLRGDCGDGASVCRARIPWWVGARDILEDGRALQHHGGALWLGSYGDVRPR